MGNRDFIVHEDKGCENNGYESGGYEPDSSETTGQSTKIQHQSASRFWKTKQYLHKVRDGIRRCALLEQRINLRLRDSDGSGYSDTNTLDDELLEAEQHVNDVKIEITDLISRLPDVNQQMVVTERYVNMKTWERIAQELNTSVRIVQKIHGRALPLLEKLVEEAAGDEPASL